MLRTDAPAIYAIKRDEDVTTRYGQDPYRSLVEARRWASQRLRAKGPTDSAYWVFAPKGEAGAIGAWRFWNFDFGVRGAWVQVAPF